MRQVHLNDKLFDEAEQMAAAAGFRVSTNMWLMSFDAVFRLKRPTLIIYLLRNALPKSMPQPSN